MEEVYTDHISGKKRDIYLLRVTKKDDSLLKMKRKYEIELRTVKNPKIKSVNYCRPIKKPETILDPVIEGKVSELASIISEKSNKTETDSKDTLKSTGNKGNCKRRQSKKSSKSNFSNGNNPKKELNGTKKK